MLKPDGDVARKSTKPETKKQPKKKKKEAFINYLPVHFFEYEKNNVAFLLKKKESPYGNFRFKPHF